MDNPDTILFQEAEAKALQEKVGLHTVQMHFFRGRTCEGQWSSCGSGILVKLGTRYFILTAGHCVRDAGSPASDAIALGIKESAHRFEPNLQRRGHSLCNGVDVGFFEVQPSDAVSIEARRRVFLSANSLYVAASNQLKERNDWMVIGGYPSAILEGDVSRNPGARLLVFSTTIAGTGTAPESALKPPAGIGELDLWVPADGNVDTLDTNHRPATVPELRGASGGGCWIAGVRPHHDAPWNANSIRLVGTHTGSCDPVQIADETHTFARELLLSHHLRLIAEEYSDLRPFIENTWPALSHRQALPR